MTPGVGLALGVVFLLLNAFFVAAEFALLASRRSKVEALAAGGDRRAESALAGLRELTVMLAGSQLGITMASLGLGAVAEPALAGLIERALGRTGLPEAAVLAIGLTLALSVVVFLHIVVGEMAPKSVAIADPERAALRLARPFRLFVRAFRPFIVGLNSFSNGIVRLLGVEPQDEVAVAHSSADLLLLLDESAQHGLLGDEDRRLLTRALDLKRRDARAVMVHRRDVVAVRATARTDEIEQVARDSGRSRLPVYDGDLDDVIGILHVKDLLLLDDAERARTTGAELAKPALVTPEGKALEELLVEMRAQRQHVAVVVDEYGGVAGLVTLEDVLEELIGEFADESDDDEPGGVLRRRADGAVLVAGDLRTDEHEQLGITLPDGQYQTVAGYLMVRLGRIPRVGDVVMDDEARLEVTAVDGPRVLEVAVTLFAATESTRLPA